MQDYGARQGTIPFLFILIPSSFCLADYAHHDPSMTSHRFSMDFIRPGLVYRDGILMLVGMADGLVRASRLFRSPDNYCVQSLSGWHWWPTTTEEGHTWPISTGSTWLCEHVCDATASSFGREPHGAIAFEGKSFDVVSTPAVSLEVREQCP